MLAYNIINLLVSHIYINRYYIITISHNGIDAAVAQRENAVYDILFYFLYLAILGSFVNHGFDFFFRNFFLCCIYMQQVENQ